LDESDCAPGGPDADAPSSHLSLEATVFEEDALLRAVRCDTADQCQSGLHFEIVVDSVSETRITGQGGEARFFPISAEEGACNLQIARVEMTRDGDAVHAAIRRLDVRDLRVPTQQDCIDTIEALTDEDCVAFEEIDLTQVR